MFELKVKGDIASAHFLRGYEGPCKDLHGHTWQIEITIKSDQLNTIGMVVDFIEIKRQLKEFLKPLDHVCLNDLPYFKRNNPTTENIAQYIFEEFSKVIKPVILEKVQVWESETSSATYYK